MNFGANGAAPVSQRTGIVNASALSRSAGAEREQSS
jgi:hypothetical protein